MFIYFSRNVIHDCTKNSSSSNNNNNNNNTKEFLTCSSSAASALKNSANIFEASGEFIHLSWIYWNVNSFESFYISNLENIESSLTKVFYLSSTMF